MKRSTPLARSTELKRSPLPKVAPVKSSPLPKLRAKKCKACGERFTPSRPMQSACGPLCAIQVGKTIAAKAERKDIAERKERLKRKADYVKEAQASWNRYVRTRDAGKPCASCGAIPEQKFGGTMDCSHYRSVGSAPHLRFHLHNAAAACVKCNRYLGGNVASLRVGLIARNGLSLVEAIEADQVRRNFTKEYLIRIKRIFDKKTRRLIARRSATC